MSEENEVPPYEDLLASLADQVSHLAYGGDPDDTGQRQIPAAEVIEWAVNELTQLRARLRLTDAERDVIEWCRQSCSNVRTPQGNRLAATLSGLLERTGGENE